MRRSSPACRVRNHSRKPSSNSFTVATGTSSMKPPVTAYNATTCSPTGTGAYWGCLSSSTMRAPVERGLAGDVELGAELGEGLQLAVLGQVEAQAGPATFFIAVTWALPPTRDTEMPTFMAGRTPA